MTKNILITGKNSYIGNQLADWLAKEPENYKVTKISVRNDKWKEYDFSGYDTVVHVAAIVHKKEKKEYQYTYKKINKDLTISLATKAKNSGVKQFIFMSSLSVYGIEGELNKRSIISTETKCKPITLYGKSKLEAEQNLSELSSENFKIVIIRAPMIYGPGSPGNYSRLSRLAKNISIFPYYTNSRSMIFIDNLSEFLKLLIKNDDQGIFHPQNEQFIETKGMLEQIANCNNKKIWFIKQLSVFISIFKNQKSIRKVFGNLMIDKELSYYPENYNLICFEKSIYLSEK